jgi:RecB family exonuclease
MAQALVQIKQMDAWSYSRYNDYEQCPAKAKYKHIEKRREPDNPAMEHGTIIHKLADQYVRGDLAKFPKELAIFKDRFALLRKLKTVLTEQEWAFNKAQAVTSWFGSDAYLRIKVDAHYLELVKDPRTPKKSKMLQSTTVRIIDYKTGREKPDHAQQRSLYALGAFRVYPDAAQVRAEHWYIDSGVITGEDFLAKQLDDLNKRWEQRTRAMMSDKRFAPRPSNACRWCHYRKSNGGPCQY